MAIFKVYYLFTITFKEDTSKQKKLTMQTEEINKRNSLSIVKD